MEDALGLPRRHVHTAVPKEVGWARSAICIWHGGWGYPLLSSLSVYVSTSPGL